MSSRLGPTMSGNLARSKSIIRAVSSTDSVVWDEREIAGVTHLQAGNVILILDQVHFATVAAIVLTHGAFYFGVALMANKNSFTPFAGITHYLYMHFGDQRTGGIKYLQLAAPCLVLHCPRYTVGRKNDNGVLRHFVQLFDKDRAALLEVIHHKLVVHHFMTHIHRRTKFDQSTVNNFDGTINASTKTAGISKTNFHGHTFSNRASSA